MFGSCAKSPLYAALILLLCCTIANAQNPVSGDNNNNAQPLEITADDTLEWHRDDLKFIARGNVNTTQDDVTIISETQTADYRETDESSFDIYRLTADQNVRILSRGNTATGQHAVYNVDQGLAVMTGDNLKITSPERTVTADDKFEYYVTEGRLTAIGNAVLVQQQDRITAAQMTAFLKDNPQTGKREIDKLTATGNVVITTPTEVLKGAEGTYDADTNTATLTGGVTITRGPNVLSGAQAEVDLTTNISKMIGGGGGSSGRVSGRFYPDSDEDSNNGNDNNTPSAPAQNRDPAPQPEAAPRLNPPSPAPKGLMTRP